MVCEKTILPGGPLEMLVSREEFVMIFIELVM